MGRLSRTCERLSGEERDDQQRRDDDESDPCSDSDPTHTVTSGFSMIRPGDGGVRSVITSS